MDLRRIERRVNAHAGLRPPAWVLEARVRDRMAAVGAADLDAYAALIEEDEAEVRALVEALRVGETRFFRHEAQLAAVRRVVIPAIAASGAGGRVRVWSAGCASGEEAWSLAILMAEGLPDRRVEVLGTDLSDEALARARRGIYAQAPATGRRWFVDDPGGARVSDELARLCRFERHNLVADEFPRDMDLVFCRNVLIYFDEAARERTMQRLVASLAPGGWLFLGYSETARGVAGLEAVRVDEGVLYRRCDAVPVTTAAASSPLLLAPPAPAPLEVVRERVIRVSGSHEDGAAILGDVTRARASGASSVIVDLDGADFLGDDVAATLRRLGVVVRATRPGPRRWAARHRLGGAA